MLKVHEAHKLVHVVYPVVLHAASSVLLVVHTIITIWYLPYWMPHFQLALVAIFVLVFIYWFVHLICGELEHPFSANCTAIDLSRVQDELNVCLQACISGSRRAPLQLCVEPVDMTTAPLQSSVRTMQAFCEETRSSKDRKRFSAHSQQSCDVQGRSPSSIPKKSPTSQAGVLPEPLPMATREPQPSAGAERTSRGGLQTSGASWPSDVTIEVLRTSVASQQSDVTVKASLDRQRVSWQPQAVEVAHQQALVADSVTAAQGDGRSEGSQTGGQGGCIHHTGAQRQAMPANKDFL